MDMKVILTPIIGAAIGYSTNWVAIKMLFRPYNEKKIMGMKVPFTPGLIPKERERIANNIGEVIEEYLLTDTVIINELLADTTKKNILKFVNKYLYNSEGNINIKNIVLSEDNSIILDKFSIFLVDKVMEFLKDDVNKEKISKVIIDGISHELKNKKVKDIIDEENLSMKYRELLNSEKTRDKLSVYINGVISADKSISDLIDQDVINNIKGAILYNIPTLINSVEDIFQNENVKQKIVALIDETIKAKVGALGAMFVNPDSIYETIVEKSKEKLQEDEVKEGISDFINEKLDVIVNKPLFEIIPEYTRGELVASLTELIPKSISKIDIAKVFDVNEKTLYTLINDMMNKPLDVEIHTIVSNKYEATINDNRTRDKVNNLLSIVLDKILSSDIIMNSDSKRNINDFIISKYTNFINKHITELIKEVKLAKIIEKQLNSFDINMIENIILSIAKKELNAITLLGGLIGFIISFLAILI